MFLFRYYFIIGNARFASSAQSLEGVEPVRKIIVLTFITLDGVMQGPGGPTEDTSGNFTYGGWTVPYFDEFLGNVMAGQMGKPFDLLLGRKTFEIFASYWPHHEDEGPGINNATKYVVSNTLKSHEWKKSVFLKGNVVDEIKKLKQEDGPDLQVHVILGMGKRLFDQGTIPASYALVESTSSPAGVIIAAFKRVGEVQTGSFA